MVHTSLCNLPYPQENVGSIAGMIPEQNSVKLQENCMPSTVRLLGSEEVLTLSRSRSEQVLVSMDRLVSRQEHSCTARTTPNGHLVGQTCPKLQFWLLAYRFLRHHASFQAIDALFQVIRISRLLCILGTNTLAIGTRSRRLPLGADL